MGTGSLWFQVSAQPLRALRLMRFLSQLTDVEDPEVAQRLETKVNQYQSLDLLDVFRPACLSCPGMSQQNVYRYYYYYGPLSVWRDGRDGLLRALIS